MAVGAEQNTAQAHRQNNNCDHQNGAAVTDTLTGSRRETRCASADESFNHHSKTVGGGADARGGSSGGVLSQQNIAQEGRQNNSCANENDTNATLSGSSLEADCTNADASLNKRTHIQGGGASAHGGSGAGIGDNLNTAQEGRQNNNCADSTAAFRLTGARVAGRCHNADASVNKHTHVSGKGARANGGNANELLQHNTAQEGRQNNNCADPNNSDLTVRGGKLVGECESVDASVNKKTVTKGGGATANGGNGAGFVAQQNVAQEGRQNNNCANPNATAAVVSGGRLAGQCESVDASVNKKTVTKGGGATASGGDSGGDLAQQNVAQEGRQNNNCANPNDSTLTLDGSRDEVTCGLADDSVNVKTVEAGGGAEARGGSSATALFQQNTAQEGRQNNNCGNPNNAVMTLDGSHNQTECLAIDHSRNIGTVTR
ncbi:hypothetical protein [Streptomyces cyanogenus]|uniref:hypothetical protein n=1 Tax=Streptomyces cyanogenus TaxID=80860 RepID=UPI001AA1959E|nr:hypothetical protein [Streptomyces cyanogenus]